MSDPSSNDEQQARNILNKIRYERSGEHEVEVSGKPLKFTWMIPERSATKKLTIRNITNGSSYDCSDPTSVSTIMTGIRSVLGSDHAASGSGRVSGHGAGFGE